jgi:hypothetical protein
VIWALLGMCWACYRLGLRARSLFGPKSMESRQVAPTWDPAGQKSRNPDRLTTS